MVIAGEAETGIPDDKRFAVELEFVQCLANPHYLNCEILVWGEELRSEGGGNGRWFNQRVCSGRARPELCLWRSARD